MKYMYVRRATKQTNSNITGMNSIHRKHMLPAKHLTKISYKQSRSVGLLFPYVQTEVVLHFKLVETVLGDTVVEGDGVLSGGGLFLQWLKPWSHAEQTCCRCAGKRKRQDLSGIRRCSWELCVVTKLFDIYLEQNSVTQAWTVTVEVMCAYFRYLGYIWTKNSQRVSPYNDVTTTRECFCVSLGCVHHLFCQHYWCN